MDLKKYLALSFITCMTVAGLNSAQADINNYIPELPNMMNTFDAITPNTPGCGFDGFYLGGGVGAQYGSGSDHSTLKAAVEGTLFPVIADQLTSRTGGFNLEGRAFIGYGYVFDRLYLGGELGGDFGQYDRSSTHNMTSVANIVPLIPLSIIGKSSLQTNSAAFTMDLLPGFLFTPTTLAYFRVGTEPNTLKFSNNVDFFEPLNLVVPFLPNVFGIENSSHSSSRWPLRLGVGVQQRITQRIDIRGDLIFEDFGGITTQGVSTIPNAPGGILAFIGQADHAKLWTSEALVSAVIHI